VHGQSLSKGEAAEGGRLSGDGPRVGRCAEGRNRLAGGPPMTRIRFFAVLASVVILLPATAGLAQDTKGAPPSPPGASQPAASAASAATPVYKPPLRGAPGGRIGGATRGVARDVFVLSVLAPDHPGLPAIDHPSLFWYISTPISLPLELTVMDPRCAQPLLETALPAPRQGGIQRVRLADHGVRLAPGGGGPRVRAGVGAGGG